MPPGVTVTGRGTIHYTGATVGLTEASVPIRFSLPSPSHADEWDLLRDVLTNLDAAAASERLGRLQTNACAPFAAPCRLDEFARQAGQRVEDPLTRWSTRREIDTPDRTFARFVRQMAVAFRWDGEVDYDEYARLWRLLAVAYWITALVGLIDGRTFGFPPAVGPDGVLRLRARSEDGGPRTGTALPVTAERLRGGAGPT